MSVRTVVVRYMGDPSSLIAANRTAAASTAQVGTAARTANARVAGMGAASRTAAGGLGLLSPKLLGPVGLVAALRFGASGADEFEASAMKLQTQIGLTAGEADAMAAAARNVGVETGIGAQEAVDASFFINSAGLRGAEAMDALERSAQAARIGMGETAQVADLVTSAMNAYGAETLNAEQATDVLVGTVRAGKAEADELTGAIGQVLPIASEMGVRFDEVGAAVAGMTRTGTNAGTAAMQLRQILASLLNPAQGVEEAMNDMGISSEQLRATIQEEGLWQALTDLRDAAGGSDEALGRMFPNVRALAGFLDLTGANAAENAKIFEDLTEATGLLDEGIEGVADTTADKSARMSANWEELKLRFGEATSGIRSDLLDLGIGLFDAADAMNEMTDEGNLSNWDTFSAVVRGFGGDYRGLIDIIEQVDDPVRRAREATAELGDHMDRMPRTANEAADAIEDVGSASDGASGPVNDVADALLASARAAEEGVSVLELYEDMIRRSVDPVFNLRRALEDFEGAHRSVEDAQRDLADAQENLSDVQGDAEASARDLADAQRDVEDAERAVEDATWDVVDAISDLERAAMDGDLSFREFETQLSRWVAEGRLTEEQADRIRDGVIDLKAEADEYDGSEFTADFSARLDRNMVNDIEREMAHLARSRTATISLAVNTSSAGRQLANLDLQREIATRASGGPLGAGQLSLVGEEGPELFVPDTAGTVIPAGVTSSMMSAPSGGVGGSTVHVSMPVTVDGQVLFTSEATIDALTGAVIRRSRETAGAGL